MRKFNLLPIPAVCVLTDGGRRLAEILTMVPDADIKSYDAKCNWYVAFVGTRQEKSSAQLLKDCGYRAYVATQTEIHEWSQGRRRAVDRVVIPNVVFICCTEARRRDIFGANRFRLKDCIRYFLVDRAGQADRFGNKPVAIVRDSEMARLRFMLDNADSPVLFQAADFQIGQPVRVIRGGLIGMEGWVEQCKDGTSNLVVRIESLGQAKVNINAADLEHLPIL